MPVVQNVRTAVIAALTPLLPADWKLVAYGANLDTLSSPVVRLQIKTIERHPAAPNGARLVTYTLTIIEPKTAPGAADDALDTNLLKLIEAIDATDGLGWSSAERVAAETGNPAFDISLTFTVTNNPAEGVVTP